MSLKICHKNKLDYNNSAFSLCVYDNNKITLYCFITEVERKVRHNLLGGYHGLVQPKGDCLLSGRQEFRISQIPTKRGSYLHIYGTFFSFKGTRVYYVDMKINL